MIKVGKITEKDHILTVEEKLISPNGNKAKRSLELTLGQRESEERRLKAPKMQIKKQI